MATRLTLVCAGATALSRIGGFPHPDISLDEGGLAKAAALWLGSARCDDVLSSPSRAAIETAGALGCTAEVETALADMDFGAWAGLGFDAVAAIDSVGLTSWFADPSRAAPGGETLDAVKARVGQWMDASIDRAPALLAISHAAVLRGAIAHALDIPVAATLNIDVAPLARLVLSYNGRWRVQGLNVD